MRTSSALSRAGVPSGKTVVSSRPVRIPCPWRAPRFGHRPARDEVAVVDLLELDPRFDEHCFHRRRVVDGGLRIGIERLDQHARAAIDEGRLDQGLGVRDGEEARFDPDATVEQVLAERDDSLLALVRGDELRQLVPAADQLEPPLGIVAGDVQRRGLRDRHARAGGPDGSHHRRAWPCGQRLAPVLVGVDVQDPRPGLDARARLPRQLLGGAGDRRMLGRRAVAVQGGLEYYASAAGLSARRYSTS